MQRAFISASVLAKREPLDFCMNWKHPDGITKRPLLSSLAWDATCPDTFAPSHFQVSSRLAGAVAAEADTKKKNK